MNTFSISEVISSAWTDVKKNLLTYAAIVLVLYIISLVIGAVAGVVPFFLLIVQVLMTPLIATAYAKMALAGISGKVIRWEELVDFKFFVPMLIAVYLTALLVFLGFVLLIVPGVILALGLVFTQLIVIDKNLDGIAAMKESWRITKGHKVQILLLLLALILVNLLGLVAFVVGLLVSIPVSQFAMAHAYRKISMLSGAPMPQSLNAPSPRI